MRISAQFGLSVRALRAGRNYAGFARGRRSNRPAGRPVRDGSAADLHVDLNSPAAAAAASKTDEL